MSNRGNLVESLQIPSGDFVIARAVDLRGFGGRRAGEVLFIDDQGLLSGSLFGGVADEVISSRSSQLLGSGARFDLFSVEIGDLDAVRAGLACGGSADVLIQHSSMLPGDFVRKISDREPIALATVIEGDARGLVAGLSATGFHHLEVDSKFDDLLSELEPMLFRYLSGRKSTVETREVAENKLVIEVFSPPTSLLIIGTSDLSTSLSRQCDLLGWGSMIISSEAQGISEARKLGSNDGLVVITHDHSIGIPIIAELLGANNKLTYLGALGSRHTQSERNRLLKDKGFSDEDVARIHGPIGLNIGSKTPEETALAICAEVLVHLSGRDASSLKNTTGPING